MPPIHGVPSTASVAYVQWISQIRLQLPCHVTSNTSHTPAAAEQSRVLFVLCPLSVAWAFIRLMHNGRVAPLRCPHWSIALNCIALQ